MSTTCPSLGENLTQILFNKFGYKMNYVDLAMAIAAGMSCLGSGSIILTYFMFPGIQKLRFIELVFYVSCNDFIASIGAGLGHTSDPAACWFQGITTNYNYLVTAVRKSVPFDSAR